MRGVVVEKKVEKMTFRADIKMDIKKVAVAILKSPKGSKPGSPKQMSTPPHKSSIKLPF
jgi:hypothetical protein